MTLGGFKLFYLPILSLLENKTMMKKSIKVKIIKLGKQTLVIINILLKSEQNSNLIFHEIAFYFKSLFLNEEKLRFKHTIISHCPFPDYYDVLNMYSGASKIIIL